MIKKKSDMENRPVNGDLKIKTPWFEGVIPIKRMAETISVLALSVALFSCYLLWKHTEDAHKTTALIWALKQEQVMATCIMSKPIDRREDEYRNPNSFCNRMAGKSYSEWLRKREAIVRKEDGGIY